MQIFKQQCVCAVDSPLSCSMKQTFPWALKARVSGVIHRVWKRWEGLMLCRATAHSAHTAHTSSSDRQLSRKERMSARDTFSCGHTDMQLYPAYTVYTGIGCLDFQGQVKNLQVLWFSTVLV